jgi:hypothetical protein
MPSPLLSPPRRHALLLAAAIAVLALLLRLQFVQLSVVEFPLGGDSRQYVAYALNLHEHHVFSKAVPGERVAPDDYRGPGYPWLLAAAMEVRGVQGDSWYRLALQWQCLLGAATVVLMLVMARGWLVATASLVPAILLALWPHHIVASSALLSEVLLGFALLAGLALAALAHGRKSTPVAVGASLCFALANLVNPAMLMLPPALAVVFWRDRLVRPALLLALLPLAVSGAWQLRSVEPPPSGQPGRAALNLVQGSWPVMHVAWQQSRIDPEAARIITEMDTEALQLANDPKAGMARLARRFADAPGYYLRWYLVEKPYLLWDWDIRVGAGGVYVNSIRNSPLESNPLLSASTAALRAANPLIFLLAALEALRLAWACLRRRSPPAAGVLCAVAFCYFTAVHLVFQAEPRYAIAYRPEELLLAGAALAKVFAWWNSRRAAVASVAAT